MPTAAVQLNPKVDAQIAAAPAFAQPILQHLREQVHAAVPGVTEEIKWGRPFFLLDGQILCSSAAFSRHCSFGFWSAKMAELLAADGIDGTGGAGSVGKIVSVADLPSKKALATYLKAAAKMLREGTAGPGATGDRTSRTVKAPLPMPADFAVALKKSKAAQASFDAFPPSARREYIDWITSAKREETRDRHVAEAVAKIAENLRHNEKYRAK